MFHRLWSSLAAPAFCGAAILSIANLAMAQDALPSAPGLPDAPVAVSQPSAQDDLKSRIERLERQNQELLEALRKMQAASPVAPALPAPPPFEGSAVNLEQGGSSGVPGASKDEVRAIVTGILKENEAKKTAADAEKKKKQEAEGHIVGRDLGMTARWNHGLWFESADHAFKFHVGGRTQMDVIGVQADQDLIKTPTGAGGIGAYDNALNWRRGRFAMEGTCFEVFNFNMEYDFFNTFDSRTGTTAKVSGNSVANRGTVYDTPAPTDLWVEVTKLPWLGNIRVGNQKPFYGFEHWTSSRFLNFMERSYGFDAFQEFGNNGFEPGIGVYNWSANQRFTFGASLTKANRGIYGWNVGDGEWRLSARSTMLAYYADNGRSFIHFGLGGYYADADDGTVRYRSRPLLRNGPASLHNIFAITNLNAKNQMMINPEFVAQWGPWLLQSEYMCNFVNDVTGIQAGGTPTGPAAFTPIGARSFFGQAAYVEILYFLTGEHRDYDLKTPRLGRVIPHRNVFFVPGEDGRRIFSMGAWQVGARYSWLDLNDEGINGGQLQSLTLGLNWFWNPNFKIQGNAELGHRNVVTGPAQSGDYQGLGIRFAFDW